MRMTNDECRMTNDESQKKVRSRNPVGPSGTPKLSRVSDFDPRISDLAN